MQRMAWTRFGRGRRFLRSYLAVLGATVLLLAALGGSAASAKTLGEWTDDDVNAGIAAGVTALDGLADKSDPTMIHWDSSPPSGDVTETAFAIAAIPTLVGFLRRGHPGWLLHLAISSFIVNSLIFYGNARYRQPIEPVCLIFAIQAVAVLMARPPKSQPAESPAAAA